MSIAEFYMEYGLDPSDPNHMDDFLNQQNWIGSDIDDNYDDRRHEGVFISGLAIAQNYTASHEEEDSLDYQPYQGGNTGLAIAQTSAILDEYRLDAIATSNGYSKLDATSSTAPMASYRRGACRLNFWLTTGTVGSYLDHPRQGKTQLFRRDIGMEEAEAIFQNPRIHTGRGYSHTNRGGRGPCRYRHNCRRVDCWFDH